jgi:DNA-binding transcriptional ArsR family regulator
MSIDAEMALTLHNIEDKLQQILNILKVVMREKVQAAQERVLSGSPLREQIIELCDGTRSVSEIAKNLNKSIQQISNNIALLQDVGLIEEIRKGKEKRYKRSEEI